MEADPPADTAWRMPGFDALCAELLAEPTPLDEQSRPTRASQQPAGFDAAAYAQADLLEVHFADGSVYYTDPQDFAARHAAATRAGGDPARVQLPFALPLADGSGTTRAGGVGGATVDRYRIARLTPPTTLDHVYRWGAAATDLLDRWFGARKPPLAHAAAAVLCHAYESSQLHDAVGSADGMLLAWQGGRWVPASAAMVPADLKEVLLLLHGTASSTEGSFKGLWQAPGSAGDGVAADWQRLAAREGSLVLACEHRSLTASPVKNVCDLLDQLQALGLRAGTTLHLLSHSRGGLLGELLTLALGTPADVQQRSAVLRTHFAGLYDGHADEAQVSALMQQMAGFTADWRAGTFVRVACPARGTLLADRRTDFFLSLLLRSVGLAFGANGNPWYERLQGLVRGLVAARADASWIPGLEAMIPGRPLSLVLNMLPEAPAAEQITLPGRLRVIAGDSEGVGTLGLASLLGDVFYGLHDHDFVVHTHAMFGGWPRTDPMSLRVSDRSVTHFGYFKADSLTRGPVIAALMGQDTGFSRLADDEARTRGLLQALLPDLSRRPRETWLQHLKDAGPENRRPILVVLPGIMGSELGHEADDAGSPVWLAAGSIFNGRLALLDLDSQPALRATGLLSLSYERVLKKAVQHFHVVTFPFDWRQPLPHAAGLLVDLLKELADQADRLDVPVHVLAHSMGGLVARMALWCDDFGLAQRRGRLTARLEERGLRLLQCGTPNAGSYAPVQLLMQQHPLTRTVARLARGVTPRDLALFGAEYGGLMGMLPAQPDPAYGDLFSLAAWSAISGADAANAGTEAAVTTPQPRVLAEAARVRDWLAASFDALKRNPQVFYLAGQGLTPLHLKLIGGSLGRPGLLRLGVSARGDGTVSWASTLAPERTFYVDCEHGSLLDHPDAFGGMFDLLLGGRTRQLSTQPPAVRGDDRALADAVFELPAPPSLLADPVAHLLGLDRRAAAPGRLPPIRVRVVHGSLDYARYPLLVGHCSDDGVHGAVKRVDTKLKGQLSQAVEYGLFGGALGTSLYLREAPADGRAPAYPGAIVVGLGPLGTLTPAGLADTLARGVLDHVFARLHQEPWSRGSGALVLNLSAVLVGSNGNAMSVRDSVAGILQGLWRAAQALAAERRPRRTVQIGELEIIELHETVALDASYALARLLERPDWQQRVHWPQGVLEAREGGVRGYRAAADAGQWQRLLVRCDEFGAMKFELIADRARVESTRNRADISDLEDFIASASDAGATRLATLAEQDEFGRGLFNQLLPQALRGRLANFERTVLMVDDRSAKMPWELLAPPRLLTLGEEAAQPLAVQAGLLRQRLVEEYRPEERAALRRPGRSTRVLVVGAPDTRGWKGTDGTPVNFTDLPAAAEEAEAVGQLLAAAGWQVTSLVRGDAYKEGASYTDIRWQLMRPEPWRVLHLAGHGMVDLWMRNVQTATGSVAQRGTGMVLSAQRMLTAAVAELMDPPPEFVFINCCYSGKDGAAPSPWGLVGRPEIAASLALAFIRMGSKAVVAAGWQVDDADGRDFAEALYRSLLRGDNFGSAVQAARHAVWRDGRPRSNTWGAYQCYGDPEWRLAGPDAAAAPAEEGNPLDGAEASKSPQELADRILQLQHGAGDGRTRVFTAALKRLQQRLEQDTVRAAWLQDSLVLSALAMTWRELGDSAAALDAAFLALRRPGSHLTLGQAVNMANLLSKLDDADRHRLDAQAAQQASWNALERLDGVGDALGWPALEGGKVAAAPADAAVAERDCLRGSALARQGEHRSTKQRQRLWLLLRAASWYAHAFRIRKQLSEVARERSYALSNAAMLAGIVAVESTTLRSHVMAGDWWHEPVSVAKPPTAAAPTPAGNPTVVQQVLADITLTLAELPHDESADFFGYAGLLDLRLGRLLLLLATGRLQDPQVLADIEALPAALESLLLRWPSPGQLKSLSKRPRQMLQALQQHRGALAAPPDVLTRLIEAVQRVIARIDEVHAELAG